MPPPAREVRNAVRDYILSEFLRGEDPSALTNRTPLITGGILDSISTTKLVVHLEGTFGVTIDPSEITVDNLDTIDAIVALIEEKLGTDSGPSP